MIFFCQQLFGLQLSVISVLFKVIIFHGFPTECPVVLGETTCKVFLFGLVFFFFFFIKAT